MIASTAPALGAPLDSRPMSLRMGACLTSVGVTGREPLRWPMVIKWSEPPELIGGSLHLIYGGYLRLSSGPGAAPHVECRNRNHRPRAAPPARGCAAQLREARLRSARGLRRRRHLGVARGHRP